MTISVWLLAGGKKLHAGQILDLDKSLVEKALWLLYVGGVAMIFLQIVGLAALDALGQLVPTLAGMASVAALALPILRLRKRLPRLTYAAALSMPMLYIALGSGMKEDLILAVLPVAFILWTSWKTPVERALIGVGAIIFIGFVTMYVGFYRDVAWKPGTDVEQTSILQDFADITEREGVFETFKEGIEGFTGRANASKFRTWAVIVADQRGYQPEMVLSPMMFVFIPRILWPEKPSIRQGWEFTGLIHGERIQNMIMSSTAAGFYPALYLGGGYGAVIAGAIGLGLLLAMLGKLAYRLGGKLFSSLFLLSLFPYLLRLEEKWTVIGLSMPIIMFVYSYLIYLLVLFAIRARSATRSTPGGRETRLMLSKSGRRSRLP